MEGRDDRGLQQLIAAAQFVETGQYPSQENMTKFLESSPPKGGDGKRRIGRKRAGRAGRFQHNQLEKDRRALLRLQLEELALVLDLNPKRSTTLLVLTHARNEIELLTRDSNRFISEKKSLLNTRKVLRARLAEVQEVVKDRRDSTASLLARREDLSAVNGGGRQPSPSGFVPPSPPNSEHSVPSVRQRVPPSDLTTLATLGRLPSPPPPMLDTPTDEVAPMDHFS